MAIIVTLLPTTHWQNHVTVVETTGQQTPLCSHSAWWGFTSAADQQRLEALTKRGIRTGLCSADIPTLTEMTESVDDALFQRIMCNPYHVIHHLLPASRELVYHDIMIGN